MFMRQFCLFKVTLSKHLHIKSIYETILFVKGTIKGYVWHAVSSRHIGTTHFPGPPDLHLHTQRVSETSDEAKLSCISSWLESKSFKRVKQKANKIIKSSLVLLLYWYHGKWVNAVFTHVIWQAFERVLKKFIF